MKKTNKKGFTIVELVIVIAVIAILAAVLIPTFAGVIERANQSAALQTAKNVYTAALAEAMSDGTLAANETIKLDANLNVITDTTTTATWTVTFTDSATATITPATASGYTLSVANGKPQAVKSGTSTPETPTSGD